MTIARIYRPAKNAMQSGIARTKTWILDFEPSEPRQIEPLMGWTTSGDVRQQLRMRFATKEEAIAYCERQGFAYQIHENLLPSRRTMAYADNFSFDRRAPWTH